MTEDAIADLARLRELAEEGRRLPLLGGRHMIMWGSVIALASTLHGALIAKLLPLPMISAAVIWFGLTGAAAFASGSLKHVRTKNGHGNDLGNRVERTVWSVGGAIMWLTSLGILAAAYLTLNRTGSSQLFLLFTMLPALMFGIYAIALRVAAEVASIEQLKPYVLLSLAFIPITLLLAGSAWQFVAMTIGVLLVSVLPGRMLIALEKATAHG